MLDEPICLICGYADYAFVGKPPKPGPSIFGSARRRVLRYIGTVPAMAGRLMESRVVRVAYHLEYILVCPFCDEEMCRAHQLSGKRREATEQRYKCRSDHRVSVLVKRGTLGWR